ncbi:hypothetical protein FKM82_020028 [Ascaphus truei]
MRPSPQLKKNAGATRQYPAVNREGSRPLSSASGAFNRKPHSAFLLSRGKVRGTCGERARNFRRHARHVPGQLPSFVRLSCAGAVLQNK